MIDFKQPIIASSSERNAKVWSVHVPSDIEVRIEFEARQVTIAMVPHSHYGERFAYDANEEAKADFISTVLGRVYGLSTKEFVAYQK